jgi:hypothetical protein
MGSKTSSCSGLVRITVLSKTDFILPTQARSTFWAQSLLHVKMATSKSRCLCGSEWMIPESHVHYTSSKLTLWGWGSLVQHLPGMREALGSKK